MIVDDQKYSLSSIELLSFGLLDFGLVSLNPAQPPLFFCVVAAFLFTSLASHDPFLGSFTAA